MGLIVYSFALIIFHYLNLPALMKNTIIAHKISRSREKWSNTTVSQTISKKISFHAVFHTLQSRQREPSVKSVKTPFPTFLLVAKYMSMSTNVIYMYLIYILRTKLLLSKFVNVNITNSLCG